MSTQTRPLLRRQRFTLSLGFAAILALIVASFGFSVFESNRAQSEARRLVSEARESAFLIGHTGQQLALLHARTEEALLKSGGDLNAHLARIVEVERDLDEDLGALSSRLTGDEARRWHEIEPLIVELRLNLDQALERAQAGKPADATVLLERTTSTSVRLFDALEELHRRGDLEVQTAVGEADHRRELARDLQVLAGFALLACTAAVAITVSRMTARQQARLDVYIDRVESSNRDLEAFAGRVAHDLKNVLAPLRLAGPILEDAANEPETVRAIAKRSDRVTRRAIDLLEGLLAFARAGAAPSFNERASVNDELTAVLEELAPAAESVSGRTEIRIDGGLAVRCSPSLLHVVLLNVLSNAFKFLQGCEERVVRVNALADGRTTVIEIEDTGAGIPRVALDRVFEPFFRVQGVRAAGTGIGLATVRRIVDAHQGKIVIDSQEGVGTRVRVELPSAAPSAEESPVEVEAGAQPSSSRAFGQPRQRPAT